ncbi:two-component system response regulator [Tolypothrix sp. LEGE 11397]|nr:MULTISPECIES: two-component system response regulator [unclassified Tolypothrix]BAY90489.1 response regulator receiver modulated metal dependent phosphohydrolase [Microchaete diplosiphon NIES-3275]EKF01087.1 response regulator [Tolypothrix sp. PCC 7601]MBE9082194.1 two-component system response regulator [Tolypothrix sp. LEGE 11397]UYD30087.1 two-component system response regulator [Tolypothrix sp. PCC 7712]UYD37984.1 two-component system response regulator [Tolypothrix sp. PCC 7601]
MQWELRHTNPIDKLGSGSNPLNKLTNVSAKDSLKLQNVEGNSMSLSPGELMLEKAASLPSLMAQTNFHADDSLDSKTLQNQDSQGNNPVLDLPKILVVDDHAASRMTAVALLAMEGYEVIEADSGAMAVDIVKEKQPDLILLDVMMPGMDGFEVCQILKQNEHTRLIPVIFITALNDRRSRIRGIEVGADDFLTKPFDRLELIARVKSLVRQKHLNEDLDHAEQVLFSVAMAIESRDPNTGDHCERLQKLGQAFGEYLNLTRNQIKDLMWGGYLHDIGKVGIPDAVLLKKGKLTAEEWEIMRQHVVIGEKICQPLRSMRGVIPIIRHHHERWDGSGYPDGLKGEEIPYLAQVFQIIDIYDALTSERPYKRSFTSEEALTVMLEETDLGWRNPHLMQQFAEFIKTQTKQ